MYNISLSIIVNNINNVWDAVIGRYSVCLHLQPVLQSVQSTSDLQICALIGQMLCFHHNRTYSKGAELRVQWLTRFCLHELDFVSERPFVFYTTCWVQTVTPPAAIRCCCCGSESEEPPVVRPVVRLGLHLNIRCYYNKDADPESVIEHYMNSQSVSAVVRLHSLQ